MAKKLWGGRFTKATDPLVEEFTRSIQYDYKLAEYDLIGSLIHVEILRKAGYLTAPEKVKLEKGLKAIHASVKNGTFKPDCACEDIHTDIQNKLEAGVGDLVLKLHTARSRNEQVSFATKMYCKVELAKILDMLGEVDVVLCETAGKNCDLVIPGFTHMQHAQPVYLVDYILAYSEMLKRDYDRVWVAAGNIDLTMGAGALAGTPIGYEKYRVAISKYIGGLKGAGAIFKLKPTVNSLDSVSDRDFVIETLSVLSIMGMHMSRFAEDFIIWSSKEFGFVEIDDAFCTGSSLMPQKKNPDVLELIRGYTGRLYGNLVSVLTMMKGLPLTYNRDMQLDKEPLFSSMEIISTELRLIMGLIAGVKFNKAKIEEHLEDEALYATDLVYYLVSKGVPFKNAHTIIGKLIKYATDNSIEIKSMTERELGKFSGKFKKEDVIKLLNPKVSVRSKKSIKRG
ncbi:MAG: argininosuccinate lyase [Candidatus Omnitrophica bacterium]|nr:argininosuccinate lyase [Candidatus Omnitrophota bacterium]MDD5436480.1 argininosuccinate lyase [Candidatus Omnitrophota bacterium]